MRKQSFRVRDVQRHKTDYVMVYFDTRTGYFSVLSYTYPLSAARWQHGKDVIRSIVKDPDKFTWLKSRKTV